ncbi:MAG: DUF1223 domain-containing protein [Pseudomonadota bacterium]
MTRLILRGLMALSLAVTSFVAVPASAQSPVVVELFTSQGCSSCPPADAMLHALAERDDVIALALHVDYWDYIGWADPFADPAHAERQRGYAMEAGRRSIYTPQMIVGGVTDIVGHKPMKLAKVIAEHAALPQTVAVAARRDGAGVLIEAEAQSAGTYLVQMVRYTPLQTTMIKRGENRGRTLDYANVTEGWQVLAEWDGVAPLALQADAPGNKPLVVLVQDGAHGRIRAATVVR